MNRPIRTIHLWLFISLLTSSLACRAASHVIEVYNPGLPTTSAPIERTLQPPTLSIPVVTPSSTIETIYPPTPNTLIRTQHSTVTATNELSPITDIQPTETWLTVTPSELQMEVFDDLWTVVNDNYLYSDFNGLDWDQVYEEYSRRIQEGMTDEAFYQAMDEMIFRLGDEHSTFFSPSETYKLDKDFAGEYNYVGIGVLTSFVPERDRLTILLVFPGSPAEQAGLNAHDSILEINGQPLTDQRVPRNHLLQGPEGSRVELTVQTPGEAPRQVRLTRQRIKNTLPVPYEIMLTNEGKQIGYLMLPTFHDSNVDERVEDALRSMSVEGPVEGLIIDNRYNGGGASDVFYDTIAYFTDGAVGHFIHRNIPQTFQIEGRDIGGSQSLPLVVLVSPETASFGEIFAGILSDLSRAVIIGETTNGNVEIMSVYNFIDGSRAWIAYQTFRPINNPGEDWEELGIIPHISAISAWDLYTLEQDPLILESLAYFDKN